MYCAGETHSPDEHSSLLKSPGCCTVNWQQHQPPYKDKTITSGTSEQALL